jgi:signal transduction histidine kinase
MIPLTVLQGHLATLRDRAPVADATMRSTVSLAMDEAHYLASLVHNLGAVARLDVDDSSALRARVDVAALAARVVGRHLPIARERRVSLDSAISAPRLYTLADLTLLEQAVSNLVQRRSLQQPGRVWR